MFRRYASGLTTTTQLATLMNDQGFRTRNKHRNSSGNGDPRLFTNASVRVILHNPFYAGKIRHKDEILPGVHEPLFSEQLYEAVQAALKRNHGRSETLHPRPEREYLLKPESPRR
jgi:site-specific DNA recombinase